MTTPTHRVSEPPTIEDFVFEFARLHATACNIPQQAIADGLMLLAENVRKETCRRLAEEAEREARQVNRVDPWFEFADWLRAKAEEM